MHNMLRGQVGYKIRLELAIQTPGCPLKEFLCSLILWISCQIYPGNGICLPRRCAQHCTGRKTIQYDMVYIHAKAILGLYLGSLSWSFHLTEHYNNLFLRQFKNHKMKISFEPENTYHYQSSRLNNNATYHAYKKSCPLVSAVSQITKIDVYFKTLC